MPSESNRVSVDAALQGPARATCGRSSPTRARVHACAASPTAGSSPGRCSSAWAPTTTPATTPSDYGYVTYEGEGYVIRGGNHLAGTHIMGTSPSDSVVDADQRSWDHENLYLVGGGSMPSIGTSNITLTLAALCFRSAEHDPRPARAKTTRPVDG